MTRRASCSTAANPAGIESPDPAPPASAPTLRQRFDAVRKAVITAPRDPAALRQEIQAMRERVRGAHPVAAGGFDIKHSPGGMVDAEFALQYLVLSQSATHPELVDNMGNITLLLRAEAAGLLPCGVGQAAATAYRSLRRVQHRARLDEAPTHFPQSELATERAAVLALWNSVFPPRHLTLRHAIIPGSIRVLQFKHLFELQWFNAAP